MEKELKDGDIIYWIGDTEVPEGEYLLDGSKWDKLLMYDYSRINSFPLKNGDKIDTADNRNTRRILGGRGYDVNKFI